jgi:hypothetical protein
MKRWVRLGSLLGACLLACGPRLPNSEVGDDTTGPNETSASETSPNETGDSSTETGANETETDTTDTTDNGDPTYFSCEGNKIFQCGDGIDNDRDGTIDTDDLECVSACDDDEGTLCDDLPQGDNGCNIDCPFDADRGSGDDQCFGDFGCYPFEPPLQDIGCDAKPPDFPACSELDPECLDNCGPRLPNGCDCFGCCEVDGQTVLLNTGTFVGNEWSCCDLDNLETCWTCEIRENCFNPCESDACELCFGQTIDELPMGCSEPSCPLEHPPCASVADCEPGWYCQTGCCTPGP